MYIQINLKIYEAQFFLSLSKKFSNFFIYLDHVTQDTALRMNYEIIFFQTFRKLANCRILK